MVYKRRELNIRHWIRRSGFGRFPSHIIHAMSTPSGSKQKESTACKAKHIRPVNISIPVYTGMNIRKVVPLLFCIAVANQIG